MFWEVWRNVTSATTSWGLGAKNANSKGRTSSKSSRKTRYNRLMSTSSSLSNSSSSATAAPPPKKSISQPVNLSKFTSDTTTTEHNQGELIPSVKNPSHIPPTDDSISSPNNTRKELRAAPSTSSSGKGGGDGCVKHSFSSFFPFSSCTFYGTMVKSKSADYSCRQGRSKDNLGDGGKGGGEITQTGTFPLSTDITREFDKDKNCNHTEEREAAKDTINWDDEDLELPSCDVCARAFPTIRQLAAHQRKKRHYGCIQCDSIFPSREGLECHREQMCHYEFAIDMYDVDEDDLNDEDDFFESDDENGNRNGLRNEVEDWQDEDMERLL